MDKVPQHKNIEVYPKVNTKTTSRQKAVECGQFGLKIPNMVNI